MSVVLTPFEVTADHPVPISPQGGTASVTVLSGDTLYYADTPQVSAANNQGSVTAGYVQAFTSPVWVRSASLSTVLVQIAASPPAVASTTASQVFTGKPVFSAGATLPVTPGPSMDVQRQGNPPFNPLSIPNCDLWLDAQNIANQIFAYDIFGRADSTTSLGSADSGLAWTAGNGTLGISSHAAYMPSPGTSANASVSTGIADSVVEAVVTFPATGTAAVILLPRFTSTINNVQVLFKNDHAATNQVQATTTVAGTTAQIGINSAAGLPNSGSFTIRVVAKGATYTAYVNGVLVLTATDAGNNFLNSTTQGLGFTNSDLASRVTAFAVSAATPADADTISAWPDVSQSVVGGTMVQATVASRPTYRASGINGKPALQFASSFLTSSYLATDKPVTVIAVINRTASAANHAILAAGVGGLEFRCNTNNQLEALKQNTSSIGTSIDTITQGASLIVAMTYDGNGSYSFYINGRPTGASLNSQTFTPGTLLQVGGLSAASEAFAGYIGEIVKFSRVVYGTEMKNLITGLAQKWGITLPVRAGQGGSLTPLQATRKVRGANISPAPIDYTNNSADPWISVWQNWNWTGWIKRSVDNVATLGANAVRIIGDISSVYTGALTQTAYNAQLVQLASYLQSKGMYLYWTGGDLRHTGGAPPSFINSFLASCAAALAPYKSSVFGVDVINEIQSGFSLYTEKAVVGWFAQWAATVRANLPGVPLTASNVSPGNGGLDGNLARLGDYTRLLEFDPYVDFYDFHLYAIPTQPVAAWTPTPFYVASDKPLVIGEFGADRVNNFTTLATMQAAYQPIVNAVINNPQILGAFHWDIASDTFGLWDHTNAVAETDVPGIYQQLPTAV